MANSQTPGETFKKAREILGLTQAELASELKISQQSLSRWEQMEGYEDVSMGTHTHYLYSLVSKLVATTYIYNTSLVKEILDHILYIKEHMPHRRLRTKMSTDTHKDARSLVSYFYFKHDELRGFKPTPMWDRDIKIMATILARGGGEGYTPRLLRECIDTFLEYDKRTKTATTDFAHNIDHVYAYLKAQAEGKRD